MASHRKYAALPDLDSAPDIYETPELTDDQSTIPPTTVRSSSDNEYDDDEDVATGISRSRLRIDQARSKFMPAAVDATDVDFSDRLASKRKSYKTSTRRRRVLEDGTEEIGNLSDEDDAGSLSRKIARLKREIEEAKEEYEKQKAGSNQSNDEGEVTEGEFESLSKVLDEISSLDQSLATRAIPAPPPGSGGEGAPNAHAGGVSYTTPTYGSNHEQTHALTKVADFDSRLLVLERALGIGSAGMPEFDAGSVPRAILPLLENLHKQISTLSEASVPSLDSISRRVRALTQEAENLEKARRNAKTAQDALASAGAAPAAEGTALEDSEQTAKINALYGTLPTIESLSPLLPPLLDRLRSLRSLHADAATAAETLARLEKRQAEMAGEIQQWREGLEKVEDAVRAGDATMTKNVEVISGWVKDLEEKMSRLS
ncbi:Dynamitin-domain-containing protein [Corynascus novoguineensis]|uniref:Dynamitin-domain-containing protein n=1 Tax=Corynascus novoguineensis TaxID=1126955 RepID=A0AAN7CZF7_9PEZI|nr:Dynamitin-domain-containing protein [Corynascus novoguineensis]